jgi:hypothetical protein
MNRIWVPFAVSLFWFFAAVPLSQAEDYTLWNDPDYSFHTVKKIYLSEIDTSPAGIQSPVKEHQLKEDFYEKADKIETAQLQKDPIAPPEPSALPTETESRSPAVSALHTSAERTQVVTSDPAGMQEDTDIPPIADMPDLSKQTAAPAAALTALPAKVRNSQSDLYVTAQVLLYRSGTGLIPAHTDWKSYQVHDVYYDRDGHPRFFTRTVNYPVYVPDTYVPTAAVAVRFYVYDVKTGRVVSSSEDDRLRSASSDLRGVYNRIIDRFFKNLKKQIDP